ncbi:hypothetical protein C7451_11317 [Blastomonas natatoria]|uniref:DUF2332 domain-containing protein n=1 Tax=Blastomonas natatoria TaxID=34015 RepID=A0A2V3UVX6_9SPHN|nr:DUF2332 domain-containing protein [Blastomonas natatoria]PXW71271.1 hypothetical protein C7451_11317 [Blastomonas natatoria]
MNRTEGIISGIAVQAEHAEQNGAPATARLCRAQIALMQGDSACGRRIAAWPGHVLTDAMPLRFTGGLHHLFRKGEAPELGPVYACEETRQDAVDAIVACVVARHDAELLPWFDGPPQTNEAGRSASFVAALHWLASRTTDRFELNEIGSSAGMNLLIDRYGYDLGGVCSGPADAPCVIAPEWQGPPPPATPFSIEAVRGCDVNPIDVRDAAAADRLMAFIWPEAEARFARMEAGIAMIRTRGVDLVQADAADWIAARLAEPQESGVTRVLMHSIVWQYILQGRQAIIEAAMEEAGAKATPERPLAWISLETNRATFRHELKVRFWPGGGEAQLLGEAQAHGAWVRWLG